MIFDCLASLEWIAKCVDEKCNSQGLALDEWLRRATKYSMRRQLSDE